MASVVFPVVINDVSVGKKRNGERDQFIASDGKEGGVARVERVFVK